MIRINLLCPHTSVDFLQPLQRQEQYYYFSPTLNLPEKRYSPKQFFSALKSFFIQGSSKSVAWKPCPLMWQWGAMPGPLHCFAMTPFSARAFWNDCRGWTVFEGQPPVIRNPSTATMAELPKTKRLFSALCESSLKHLKTWSLLFSAQSTPVNANEKSHIYLQARKGASIFPRES